MKRYFLLSASMTAISLTAMFGVPVAAQSEPPAAATVTTPPESPATVASTEEMESGRDIIVTATKRGQNLMEVPIQVSVVTSENLTERGITQASQLLGSTPNVTFIEDNAGEAYINIRGQTAVRASDPNVAIVIDGVVLSSTKAFNRNIFGIEQIEIVKGPQTALYGRNAAAGAVVITTKRPGDTFSGEFAGSYGSFNTVRASAAVSGPLTDTLGFTVAGSVYGTNGPFKSSVADFYVMEAHNTSLRGRLFYDNKDKLTVDLKVDYFKVTGAGIGYNAQFVGIPIGPWPGDKLDVGFTDQPFVTNIRGTNDNKYIGGTLKIEYDLGFADFTSISGISQYDEYFGGDGIPYLADTGNGAANGAIVTQYSLQDNNYSQELRLTSPGSQRFRWQVGATFLRFDRKGWNKVSEDNLGVLPPDNRSVSPAGYPSPTIAFGQPVYKTTNYAAFGNVQYDITDAFTISLAGRYDIEKRSVAEVAPLQFNQCVIQNDLPLEDCNAEKTFKEFSPKVTLTYKPSNEFMAYASYGKGFKSGGFNPIGSRNLTLAVTPPEFQDEVYVQDIYTPEISKSFEIGTKVQLFDRRLFLNAAIFKTDVKGAQQFAFFPSTGLQTVVSIDKVKLKGFDAGLDWISGGTTINLGFGYTDGKIDQFVGNPNNEGNKSPGSAEYTINAAVQHAFAVNPELELVPRVEFTRAGPIWWDVDNTPGTRRDPLNLVNARLTLRSSAGWQIAGYVDNLTNEKYYQEIVPLLSVLSVQFRGWTRSYGVEARYNF